jgi:hypothetical protein
MGAFMKSIFLISLLALVSCGNEQKQRQQNIKTSSPYGIENNGVISIPAPGIVGATPSLMYGNSYSQIGILSNEASIYIQALSHQQINVAPLSYDTSSIKYRVNFSGTFVKGPCPTNPTYQCDLINLQSLRAY